MLADVNNDSPPKRQRRKHDVTSCVGDCGWRHTNTSGVSAGSLYERRSVNNRTQLASNGGLYRIAQRKRPHKDAPSTCCSGYTVVITIAETSAAELKSVPLSHDTAARFPQTGVTALTVVHVV